MRFSSLVAASSLLTLARGLYVAKGSPCYSKCNGANGTFWPDLVCSDDDFATTTKGQTLQSCLTCTSTSLFINNTYTDGNSDQYWFMFHLKYTQETCLIDTNVAHIAAVNACSTACAPLGNVLDSLWISSHPFRPMYDYCSQNSSSYPNDAPDCAKCLQAQTGSVALGNFVDTMSAACISKPLASSGEIVALNRDLFDTSTIAISTSSASSRTSTTSTTPTSGTLSTTSTSSTTSVASTAGVVSATSSPSAENSNKATLSSGATLGIGLGIGLTGFAIIVAVAVFFLRRKKSITPVHEEPAVSPYYSELDKTDSPKFNYVEKSGQQVYEVDARPMTPLVELPAYHRG